MYDREVGKSGNASRTSYRVFNGPIAPGLHVLHQCDNPRCINPGHLFLGTHDDNMADKRAKKRGKSISRPGTKNPAAKLNETQVLAIRADARSQVAIAAEYGVSQMMISCIKRRTKWTHI